MKSYHFTLAAFVMITLISCQKDEPSINPEKTSFSNFNTGYHHNRVLDILSQVENSEKSNPDLESYVYNYQAIDGLNSYNLDSNECEEIISSIEYLDTYSLDENLYTSVINDFSQNQIISSDLHLQLGKINQTLFKVNLSQVVSNSSGNEVETVRVEMSKITNDLKMLEQYFHSSHSFQTPEEKTIALQSISVTIYSLDYWNEVLGNSNHLYHNALLEKMGQNKTTGAFWDAVLLVVGADLTGAVTMVAGGAVEPSTVAVVSGVCSALALGCVIWCD